MNTIQGYDLIDGNCEPCRDRDKCQFLNKDICELTAQSLIRPMSGPYCKIEGQNGNTFYVQLGDTYKYIINTPTLGAMCVAQVCGGGREYCNEYSFADPDAVLVQLNSSLNSKIITTAQSLSDDFDVYGMAFKYIDPLDLQSLEITKNTLSALPPNMYIGMTLVFYDAQRSTNDGFADLVGKKAYVVATCNENEDCSVNATTIVHELTHLHQHEEYISSYCESENKFCSLLDAYNSARERDEACVGNQVDSGASCDNEKKDKDPDFEKLAQAASIYCVDPEGLSNSQKNVFDMLKETIFEGKDCNL